ncbi:MAG TPA: biotin--[acetyl-CoA-carboxylase] ligase [Thermoleophilaceae bacterium]|jgi:BirA family biotin operon repressor/biotin-[acetyl-CoA-carboxylase] ligase
MIGSPRVHHRTTDSTNERAKELALGGAPHGTLVTADEQTAGRGRQGRQWVAPPGKALLMSVVLRHLGGAQAHLPLAAALAACEAAELSAPPVHCTIKWPNDVWIDGRKLAGILVEGRPQEGWAVLGIGLNVATSEDEFPEELRGLATSLSAATGNEPPPLETVLDHLLRELDARLDDSPDAIVTSWRERDALRGQPVRWQGGAGTATGIDDSGALIVETSTGRVTLDAGEVHLLR